MSIVRESAGGLLADGEVFDTLLSHGIDKAVEVAKYYDFIEVMPPATAHH